MLFPTKTQPKRQIIKLYHAIIVNLILCNLVEHQLVGISIAFPVAWLRDVVMKKIIIILSQPQLDMKSQIRNVGNL